jgi:hypothetical protein
VFTALKFTKPKTLCNIPSLRYKEEGIEQLAESFQDQCKAFSSTLFPTPPTTEAPDWGNFIPCQWEWPELESIEVKTAIFSSSTKKVLGLDRLSFAILQKSYLAIEDIFNRVYKIFFQVGYHPKIWKEAVGVILPK